MMYLFPHDAHIDAWKVMQIEIIKIDAPISDYRYQATFGDYDLDCIVGRGATELEAKRDLCFSANVWFGE